MKTSARLALRRFFSGLISVIGLAGVAAGESGDGVTLEAEDGGYRYTVDVTQAPDLAEWVEDELLPTVRVWYPKLVEMLPGEDYTAPDRVSLEFRSGINVPAYASGNRVTLNLEWFRGELDREALGCVVHELVHVVQNYGRARRTNPEPSRTPGWVVEGIADYIRWFLYEPETGGADITARNIDRARYDGNYRVSGNFLNWVVENHDADLIQVLNEAAREGRYSEEIWRERTGHSVEELGAAWLEAHEERLAREEAGEAAAGADAEDSGSESKPAEVVDGIEVADGFRVERVYSVPRETQGSWVSLAVDPEGRLIASDQSGVLYRVTPPGAGTGNEAEVERIEVWLTDADGDRVGGPIGNAQGLEYAFDSLYVVVNGGGIAAGPGVYRLRDTTGDDRYDEVTHLARLEGGGEHGPHAIRVGPDGDSLYAVMGNATQVPDFERSRVPPNWDEDLLLPRMWDPRGHAVGWYAPGGKIVRMKPDGSDIEIVSSGFRNAYDFAFNHNGDLFTYDSDMEWDIGMPWYRPIRVVHATSGSEFGWRSGSGKWPVYYPDSLPPLAELGAGSPTGVTFGYGADFPARYRDALFLCDWSFGEVDLVRLEPDGATYRAAEIERFINGTPLPLTAMRVNPHDGALYFTVGGRGAESRLYRVTYVGDESVDSAEPAGIEDSETAGLHELRRKLEAFHGRRDPEAMAAAWEHLGHEDRFIRYAARVAIEHQPVEQWQSRALEADEPAVAIEAMVALARQGNPSLQSRLVEKLVGIDYASLSRDQRLAYLRAWQLVFVRMGEPGEAEKRRAVAKLDPLYPADSIPENRELSRLAVYLEMPGAVERTVDLMLSADTPEQQIHYASVLRSVEWGWTPELRRAYFEWFPTMADTHGGASFRGFIDKIREDALETLTEAEKATVTAWLEEDAEDESPGQDAPREFQRAWSAEELVEAVGDRGDLSGISYERGREAFAAARCFDCHRVAGEGGIGGPDLTQVGQRFSIRDLAEKIVNPSENVSDQYANTIFELEDGTRVVGRIANLQQDSVHVITSLFEPGNLRTIDRNRIVDQSKSPYSPMPPALVNTLDEDEVRALFAFLLSRGDPDNQ